MLDCSIRVYCFFNFSGNMKQTFGRGYPALYHYTLLYFILSKAIVAIIKHILLKFTPIIPAFSSLLFPSYYSNNFACKIDTSLIKDDQCYLVRPFTCLTFCFNICENYFMNWLLHLLLVWPMIWSIHTVYNIPLWREGKPW